MIPTLSHNQRYFGKYEFKNQHVICCSIILIFHTTYFFLVSSDGNLVKCGKTTEHSRVKSCCFDVCSSGEVEQRNRPRGSHAGYRYACTVCADIINNYFFKPRPNCNCGLIEILHIAQRDIRVRLIYEAGSTTEL